MHKALPTLLLLPCLLLVPALVQGEDRPRWMSPEAGWVDEETDTRVEKVTRDEESGGYRVEISVPQVEKPIEEVVVVGVKEEEPDVGLPIRYEVIDDFDSGRRGIILYMGSDDPFALRINYDEGAPQKAKARDPGLIKR